MHFAESQLQVVDQRDERPFRRRFATDENIVMPSHS
jgi:hypothetical protein